MATDLEAVLRGQCQAFSDFGTILDFGCGSGRTLRWITRLAPEARLFGTDIDAEAIAWIAAHLPYVTASVNGREGPPPLPRRKLRPDLRDLSVHPYGRGASVLLVEELCRVMRPGGLLLASLHGHDLWKDLSPEAVAVLRQEGVFVAKTRLWDGVFPEWYQNTYHSVKYVRDNFGKYFEFMNYLPLALDGNHDVVILKKS